MEKGIKSLCFEAYVYRIIVFSLLYYVQIYYSVLVFYSVYYDSIGAFHVEPASSGHTWCGPPCTRESV